MAVVPWAALLAAGGLAMSELLSASNNNKMERLSDNNAALDKAYYKAKENEDAQSNSKTQQLVALNDRKAKQQIENASNVSTISGATPEFAASVQKGVAQSRADLMGGINAEESRKSEMYANLGEEARRRKNMEDMARLDARNQSFAALAANAGNVLGSFAGLGSDGAVEAGSAANADHIGRALNDKMKQQPSGNAPLPGANSSNYGKFLTAGYNKPRQR